MASVTSWADATTGLRRFRNRKKRYGTRPPSSRPIRAANQVGNFEVFCSGLPNTSWKIGPGIRCSTGISRMLASKTPLRAGMICSDTRSDCALSGLATMMSMYGDSGERLVLTIAEIWSIDSGKVTAPLRLGGHALRLHQVLEGPRQDVVVVRVGTRQDDERSLGVVDRRAERGEHHGDRRGQQRRTDDDEHLGARESQRLAASRRPAPAHSCSRPSRSVLSSASCSARLPRSRPRSVMGPPPVRPHPTSDRPDECNDGEGSTEIPLRGNGRRRSGNARRSDPDPRARPGSSVWDRGGVGPTLTPPWVH